MVKFEYIIIILASSLYMVELYIEYSIIYFILIVISLSYIIYMYNIIYISLILIIVYSTALIILFGFIVMKNIGHIPLSLRIYPSYYYIYLFILLSIFIYIYSKDIYIFYNIFPQSGYEYNIKNIDIITIIGNILYKDPIYIVQVLLSAIILLSPILAILYL